MTRRTLYVLITVDGRQNVTIGAKEAGPLISCRRSNQKRLVLSLSRTFKPKEARPLLVTDTSRAKEADRHILQ